MSWHGVRKFSKSLVERLNNELLIKNGLIMSIVCSPLGGNMGEITELNPIDGVKPMRFYVLPDSSDDPCIDFDDSQLGELIKKLTQKERI